MRHFLACLLGFACLVTACSGGGGEPVDSSSDVGSGRDRASDSGRDGAPGELAMTPQALGEQVRLGLLKPSSYRPDEVVLTDQSAVIVSDLLYDGLTEAVSTQGELRPGLARQWSANDDFTVWTFQLDSESGVTAGAVVDSLAPFSGERTGRAPSAAAVLAAGIRSVHASDDSTVVVELVSSNAGLPWVLSGLPFSVIGPDGAATGDFEVVSDDTNGMVLWRSETGGTSTAGQVKRVVVTWAGSAELSHELLTQGRVDAAISTPALVAASEPGVPPDFPATAATRFYVLNHRSPALDRPEARRAVLAAIDPTELIAVGFSHSVLRTDGLLGATMAGYRPGACSVICRHDPSVAAELASVAGIDLRISYTGNDQGVTAEAIVAQLAAAGIRAETFELGPQELAKVIVRGDTDLFSFGWVAAASSGDAVIPPLLAVDSPANIARLDVPAVSELLAEAAVTADDDRRWAILDEAHRVALDEAVILPVAGSTSVLVRAPQARGMALRADGSIDLDSTS